MTYDLAGKNVLVTGGSSGIGAALATTFAAAGAKVGICARREDRLREVLDECRRHSPDSRMWAVDLSLLDDLDAFARRVENELGPVDVLVNNAGIPKRRHVRDLTPDVVESVMAINYFSPVRLTLALLPGMLERGDGRIVNISSVAARLSPPREAAYAATKAALSTFFESLATDVWGSGVLVHLVNPGIIDTELFHLPDNEPSLSDLEALPASDLAAAVVRQLDEGTLEIYVPDWFADVAANKAKDVGAFLAGSAAWVAQRTEESGAVT
jgi:NAD(P)-dependent dehydrogenase (short-subunit alcohol dehydrogenase family)